MKDKNWKDMVEKQGLLRYFGSTAIRKAKKGEHTSAQEIDLLFRLAVAKQSVTPGELTSEMGISKSMISRLVEQLQSKKYIEKIPDASDKRSYTVQITPSGKEEIDRMYYYYLDPLYTLRKEMGQDRFEELFALIKEADQILYAKEKEVV